MSAPGPESLVVGVPRETKPGEQRIAVTPDGVRELTARDVPVVIEAGAGLGSGVSDDEYRAAGASVVADPLEVWTRAEVVCKVKEPQAGEFAYLRPGLVLFTYLHLAAPARPTLPRRHHHARAQPRLGSARGSRGGSAHWRGAGPWRARPSDRG